MKAKVSRKPGLVLSGFGLIGVLVIAIAILALVAGGGRNNAVQLPDTIETQPGDRVALTGDLDIEEGEVVELDAKALDGDIEIEEGANVTRDVIAWGGDIDIRGIVGGNVTAFNGNIRIRDGARVEGDVNAPNGRVEVSDEGTVVGKILANERAASRGGGFAGFIASLIIALLSTLLFVAGGSVLVMAWPRRLQLATSTLSKSFGSVLAVGLLTALFLPFVLGAISFVLAITLIGILLIPVVWLAALGLWFYGMVTIGLWIGQRLAESGRVPSARQSLLATTVVGLTALSIISFFSAMILPVLGWPVLYLLGFSGAGAGILSRFGSPTEWSKMPQVIATGAGRVTRRLTGQPPVPPDEARKAS